MSSLALPDDDDRAESWLLVATRCRKVGCFRGTHCVAPTSRWPGDPSGWVGVASLWGIVTGEASRRDVGVASLWGIGPPSGVL
jgi:hypothetical protein